MAEGYRVAAVFALALVANIPLCTNARGVHVQVERGVIGEFERVCDLRDVRAGWITPSFSFEGCITFNGTGSDVSDSDAELMAAALTATTTLKSLLLENCGLSDAAVIKIANAVATHDTLRVLNLAGNGITAAAAASLVKLIETNVRLAILDLQRNELMSTGIKEILSCVEGNNGLIELSLNDNGDDVGHSPEEHTADGAVARGFSGLLHERTDLKVLRIGSTGISNPGVHLIMEALGSNDHLEEFEIGFNEIGPDGGELIGEALMRNKVLKRLYIDGSSVGDEGAAEIAHALRFNTAIEILSMKSNKLTATSARYFADVLEEIDWTGLKELHLGYRDHGITGEWYHYIEKLLKIHGNRSQRNILLKSERQRICSMIYTNSLDIDCDLLINKGYRRMGDILILQEQDCEKNLDIPVTYCIAIANAAKSLEKALPTHVEL